jgi:hypothetical protein
MPGGDFFAEEKGDSQLNIGKPYLISIANQVNHIRIAERDAFINQGNFILGWLIELRCFYDLIENQLKVRSSKKETELFEYKLIDNKMQRTKKTVLEKEKFLFWFIEIEKMFERVSLMQDTEISNFAKYKKYKEILVELSEVTREIYAEANKRHLIMPDLKVDMKELAKSEWIDRDFKRDY